MSDFPLSDRAEDLWGLASSAAESEAPDEELAALIKTARTFTLDNWAGLLGEQARSGIKFGWWEALNDSESLAKYRSEWGV